MDFAFYTDAEKKVEIYMRLSEEERLAKFA